MMFDAAAKIEAKIFCHWNDDVDVLFLILLRVLG